MSISLLSDRDQHLNPDSDTLRTGIIFGYLLFVIPGGKAVNVGKELGLGHSGVTHQQHVDVPANFHPSRVPVTQRKVSLFSYY
jgi:hypothetical protein